MSLSHYVLEAGISASSVSLEALVNFLAKEHLQPQHLLDWYFEVFGHSDSGGLERTGNKMCVYKLMWQGNIEDVIMILKRDTIASLH